MLAGNPQHDLSPAPMLEYVGRGFRDGDGHLAGPGCVESNLLGKMQGRPANFRNSAGFRNGDPDSHACQGFHRAIITLVPFPGAVIISTSLLSRFAPPNPKPSPPPLVKPSFRACSTSAIPGP